MKRAIGSLALVVGTALALVGCDGGGGGGGKAVESVQSSGETITLSTRSGKLSEGTNEVTVTITDASGQPADVQAQSIQLYMPPMSTMPPMRSEAPLEPAGKPGVFKGTLDVGMNGTWQTTVAYLENGTPQRAVFNVRTE